MGTWFIHGAALGHLLRHHTYFLTVRDIYRCEKLYGRQLIDTWRNRKGHTRTDKPARANERRLKLVVWKTE